MAQVALLPRISGDPRHGQSHQTGLLGFVGRSSMGFRYHWDLLLEGQLDFVGQRRAFNLQSYAIWISGLIGFVHGYIEASFAYTFYWIFGTSVVIGIVCLPSRWFWNRNRLEWLTPKVE